MWTDERRTKTNPKTSPGQSGKLPPPPGGHTNILTNFELDRDIIGTNLLTKFHEDRKRNVPSKTGHKSSPEKS
ncbi:hypothetical protein DPMN_166736, partial [Dreissena polymorpha]